MLEIMMDELPLHIASKNGHVDVVREVVIRGAQVDAKQKDG